jgi:hypothetical protein
MASDSEDLVLSISADVRQIQRALKRLETDSGNTAKVLQQQFATAGAEANATFDKVAANSNKMGTAVQSAGKRFNTAMKASSLQTANLAAQLNDIGVQLAGGQSPFQIALQQGTQINQVLGSGGAVGAVKALGGAFMSIINPVSLATIGIIALGGAAIQWLTSVSDDVPKVDELLKNHAKLIRDIQAAYGDAAVGSNRYAETARANLEKEIADQGIAIQAALEDAQKRLAAVATFVTPTLFGFEEGGIVERFKPFEDAIRTLLDEIKAGNPDYEKFNAATREIAATDPGNLTAIRNELTGLVQEAASLSQSLAQTAGGISDVDAAFGALSSAINAIQTRDAQSELQELMERAREGSVSVEEVETALHNLSGTAPDLSAAAGSIMQLFNAAIAAKAAIDALAGPIGGGTTVADGKTSRVGSMDQLQAQYDQALNLAQRMGDINKAIGNVEVSDPKKASGGGRDKAAEQAKREAQAVVDLIDALEFEKSLIGLTDVQREQEIALRKAGAAATDEQRSKISGLVAAIAAEEEAIEAANERMEELKDISKDVLSGFAHDLKDGVSAAEALSNALDKIADKLLDSALDSALDGLFKGLTGSASKGLFSGGLLGGAIIPGILHDGGVAGSDGYGHGRSVSPGVFAGARRYHTGGIAGLAPGEVPAILQRGEVVLPRGTKAGGTETIKVELYDDSGRMAAVADQRIQTASGAIVQVSVQQSRKAIKGDMPGLMANAQKRAM